MNYPVWEPFIANGVLIGVIAIVHVFVSHFAIGGGLYLVLAEIWARRRNDDAHLAYLERYSRFFVLLTLVFGAVTGVAIWVTIGLIHPVGTKWLINHFVWGWATEWVMFFLEITAAMLYLYGWRRLAPKLHLAIGWIYFVTAWLSLVIINGILTFMLTPGGWLATGSFWEGFFNPGFLPGMVFRTGICLALAGLYASLTAAREQNAELKTRMLRFNGALTLGALAVGVPSGYWYFLTLPPVAAEQLVSARVPALAVQVMLAAAGVLALAVLVLLLLIPRRTGAVAAGVMLALALVAMGGFEWAREAIRKPYVIHEFLYSNNLLARDAAALPAADPLPVAFSTGDRGRDLYLHGCRSCHTIDGYHPLREYVAGLDEAWLAGIVPRLHLYREKMPPFPGNAADAAALGRYLKSVAGPDPLAGGRLSAAAQDALAFGRRCGGCHTLAGNFRPLADAFAGLTPADAADIVAGIGDMSDSMPSFTGSDGEKERVARHLTGGAK
jgi:cytochrome bd-type quinol oxidase subunit 1